MADGDRHGAEPEPKAGGREKSGSKEQKQQVGCGPQIWGLGSRKALPGAGGSSGRAAPPTCAGLGPCGTGKRVPLSLPVSQPGTLACRLRRGLPAPRPNPQTSRPAVPRPARTLPRWGCPAAAAAAARRLGRSVPHCPRERRPLTTATRRARPSRPSAAAARPAPRAAVRPERRPLPGGLGRPSLGGSSRRRERGPEGGGSRRERQPSRAPPAPRRAPSPCALCPPGPLARRLRRAPRSTPVPALPGPGSDLSERGLRPSARPGSRLSSLLRHPSPRWAFVHQDPRPSATHSFREARPLSAPDRLPDRLEEGPESGVIPCTPPRHSPQSYPQNAFLGLGSQGPRRSCVLC
ncbi:hypothetical protein GH733_003351 [Mirounga leonina]|nr:hypothetical protein GH733_003351 [Mirounga leonina]